MAWWAEYKRCLRYCKHHYYHWIGWYRRKLHDDWYNSLTNEEKLQYQRERELRRREFLLFWKYCSGLFYNNI